MFSRVFLRSARRGQCLYQIACGNRGDRGWSNYNNAPSFTGVGAALIAASGTAAVAMKIAANEDEQDCPKNNYLKLMRRSLTAPTAMAVSQEDTKSARDTESELKQKREEAARDILIHCGVNDKEKRKEIINKMSKYLEHKEKGTGGVTETEMHLINDAIYGPIELSPLLYQIINTKEFQRLKDLRQLGGTHYVYPGANHTRFEHSIGVSYVARIFAESLKKQLEKDKAKAKIDVEDKEFYKFTEEEVLCAEIAGLCHDLGHGPLSHMFEKVMKESLELHVDHEKISVSMLERLLTNPKVLGEFVYEGLKDEHVQLIGHMISPPPLEECDKRLFLYEIVANKRTGIDVDKWDYYQRDCHYLGILQDFQWRRTMLLGRILMTPDGYEGKKQLRIAFRDKEMGNLYGMFRTRASIHQKACQHKTIKAIERMYIEAMDLVQDLQIVWVPTIARDTNSEHVLSTGSFKSIKESVELATKEKDPNLDWYIAMSDSIIATIRSANVQCTKLQAENLAKAKDLLRRVEERDLYTCSAKKRVAKFCPMVKFLKPENSAYALCKLCGDQLEKDPEVKALKDMYDDHKLCQKFDGMVHDNLLLEEKSIIQKDKIWTEVVKIKHPSEKKDNPVNEVIFFKKSRSPHDLPETLKKDSIHRKASMVVVPQAFIEYELRVYDKRPKVERKESHQKALENAMEKAWRVFVDSRKSQDKINKS